MFKWSGDKSVSEKDDLFTWARKTHPWSWPKKKKDGQFSIIFASFFPNNYGQIIVKIESLFVYDQSEKPMYDQLEKPMHKNSYLNIPVGIF